MADAKIQKQNKAVAAAFDNLFQAHQDVDVIEEQIRRVRGNEFPAKRQRLVQDLAQKQKKEDSMKEAYNKQLEASRTLSGTGSKKLSLLHHVLDQP